MAATLFGLLGWPVGHSISPEMVNAAFAQLGLPAYYTAFAVAPEDFDVAVRGLAALRAGGVNVTIPHKQQALQMALQVTTEAQLAGAVNTLKFVPETREILGHNTDVAGWWTSLMLLHAGRQQEWAKVMVLGAGGASRAVLAGLVLHLSEAEVWISARKPEQASRMAAEFAAHLSVKTVEWEVKEDWIAAADLVVNTTPVGMWPHPEHAPVTRATCFHPGQVVQDLVYRPLRTQFLHMAAQQGATVVEGVSMLVEQGAQAIEFWTGRIPDRQCMLEAALAVLRTGTRDRSLENRI